MIPEDKIAEIREAVRISEFIAPYVDLKRKGRSMMGLCPFHSEKTPSFSVSDDNGFFHCFGCGAAGNVFKFLMLIESLSFPDAVRKVASHCGIEVPEVESPGVSRRQNLYEVAAACSDYFRMCLEKAPIGAEIRDYLAGRGISAQSIEEFCLGASPTSGDGLVRWFAREGLDLADGEKLGLIGRRGGRSYDKLRGRLMFPIRDVQGRALGFGARLVGEGDGPKYLNSPDSDAYHKGKVLYGLFEARRSRQRERSGGLEELVLVEGYFDVIALHQAGVRNAVATCGTALTTDQVALMKRYAPAAITLFDGDGAGRSAAARSFAVFVEAGMWPKGASVPEGEDPDTIARAEGEAGIRRLLSRAEPLAEAYVRHLSEQPGGAAQVGAELSKLLAKVSDPFERDVLVRKAALWTGLSEGVLRRGPAPPAPAGAAPLRAGAPSPEELLVTLMLIDRNCVARVDDSAIVISLEEEPWASVARSLVEERRAGRHLDTAEGLDLLPEAARARVASRLVSDMFAEAATREQALRDCMGKIERRRARKERAALVEQLRRKEDLGQELEPERDLSEWNSPEDSDA